MTTNKLGLSVVAASLVASSLVAGTFSLDTSKVSKELLKAQAVDVNITKAIKYTNTMSNTEVKSASEAGFELDIPGLNSNSNLSNLVVQVDDDTNTTVAKYSKTVGTTIVFAAESGKSATENETYRFVSADKNTSINAVDLALTAPKDAESVTATAKTTSNDGVSILDTASGAIIEVAQQYSFAVDTQLSASVDAAADFLDFTTADSKAKTTHTDIYEFTYTDKGADLDFNATATAVNINVISDVNLSTYALAITGDINMPATVNDMNITFDDNNITDVNGSHTDTFTFTESATDDMGVVNFTANASVTIDGGVVVDLANSVDAGDWGIYGYTAQIPNVVGLAGNIETTMKFTNRSDIDSEIYFTLIDPDGTVATLNSKDNASIASLAKGTTGTYKASALIALVDDADFDGTGSISVEVAVPTTPNSVYGMASFKNITLGGQFKDLPVYNSSEMAY
jgi:hypothetical protein